MKLVRMPLEDVKPGTKLVDPDGRVTTVTGVTMDETPEELFELELVNDAGVTQLVRADSGHVWPLDPSSHGRVPSSQEGETEASTGSIARWVAEGWHPQLAPVLSNGRVIHWSVKTATLLPEKERLNTKVKCVRVDSPTHSFMIADNPDHDGIMASNPNGPAPDHEPGNAEPTEHKPIMGDPESIQIDSPIPNHNDNAKHKAVPLSVVEAAREALETEHEARARGEDPRRADVQFPFMDMEGIASTGVDDLPGVTMVNPETFRMIADHGLPTHNCGGPLTLDTLLQTPDGPVSMSDIQVHDRLMFDGMETEVLWKSPLMMPDEILEFQLEDATINDVPAWTPEDVLQAEEEYHRLTVEC